LKGVLPVHLLIYRSLQEFGVVSFEFDSGGPSRIDAWVPPVSAGGQACSWQPDSEGNGIEAAVDALASSGY